MATTTTTELDKSLGWVLFEIGDINIVVSQEGGDLAYWRLGTDPDTIGHNIETGDLITFYEDVYIRSSGKTKLTVTT